MSANGIHSRVRTAASDIAFVRSCLIGDSSSSGSGSGTGSGSALGIRLDGRSVDAFRPLCAAGSGSGSGSGGEGASIKLFRDANSACCEFVTGSGSSSSSSGGGTRVVTVVRGQIVSPYPDRPTEGILQIDANMSPGAATDSATATAASGSGSSGSVTGFGVSAPTSTEVTRHLERVLRDADTIDLEVR